MRATPKRQTLFRIVSGHLEEMASILFSCFDPKTLCEGRAGGWKEEPGRGKRRQPEVAEIVLQASELSSSGCSNCNNSASLPHSCSNTEGGLEPTWSSQPNHTSSGSGRDGSDSGNSGCTGLRLDVGSRSADCSGYLSGVSLAGTPGGQLLRAARVGDVARVGRLLKRSNGHCSDLLATADQLGWTALHFASSKGRVAVVKQLLDAGARSTRDIHGISPKQLAKTKGLRAVEAMLAAA